MMLFSNKQDCSIITIEVFLIVLVLGKSQCQTQTLENTGQYPVHRRSLNQAAEKARAASMISFTENNFESAIDNFESVIDGDERTLVQHTYKWPYSAIGRIQIDCRSNIRKHPLVCTGTLIGARTVLTAAHCIAHNNTVCKNVTFAPGQQGNILPFGISKVEEATIPPEWYLLEDAIDSQRYDFAVLTLEDALGLKAGWFAYGADCGTQSHEFKVAGYPADLDRANRAKMFESHCSNVQMDACRRGTEPGMFNHKCDTFGGMSGAPLWIQNKDGINEIRGIHTKGVDPNSSITTNSGVYISPEAIDYITIILA